MPRRMIHVLVVDDHPIIRRGLQAEINLDPEMQVVGEARDGKEAVELARTLKPDVILMDAVMPQKDGIEATAEIIREKGTNRSQFFRGFVDKYTWVDVGSSYLPSELQSAYLATQLESLAEITADRLGTWRLYQRLLAGLPELEYEICTYDEGLIAALLESFSGKAFSVKEVDCWCTGDRTCRFTAEVAGA